VSADFGDLATREARHAEPKLEGNRWWPSEPERLVRILEEGGVMTKAERAVAERELAARERRSQTPPVLRREDVVFEQSSRKGLQIATIIGQHRGIEVRNVGLDIYRLIPGAHTEAWRSYEGIYHVLNGNGYLITDGKRTDFAPHDTFHVQHGVWYQLFNPTDKPIHLLAAHPGPMLEHLSPYSQVYKGDSFSDPPDDFKPEHPFTKERVAVGYVGGEKWMSHLQMSVHERTAHRKEENKEARIILKAADAVIERSEHKGDWKVGLCDHYLGFANKTFGMYIHQMPPASHTETHKHGEAIVYVLSGYGYTIVEGERSDWRAGDCIFVKPGQWHQHFNSSPDQVSQHVALYTQPLRELVYEGAEVVEAMAEDDYQPSAYDAPAGEWWK
jgi:mannose-6-phosphate isomerase-like protein (cupin superfamily)